jgi:hypothetical protein
MRSREFHKLRQTSGGAEARVRTPPVDPEAINAQTGTSFPYVLAKLRFENSNATRAEPLAWGK